MMSGGLENDCTYFGSVRGKKSSYAGLSVCSGLSGYIQTDDELLFVQPENTVRPDGKLAHIIYTC